MTFIRKDLILFITKQFYNVSMKKVLLVLFICAAPGILLSQQKVQIRISKPYCLFNFLETMNGSHAVSGSLKQYADSYMSVKSKSFLSILENYKTIQLYYPIRYDEFPTGRSQEGSTFDIISSAAVHAKDIDDFSDRILGILPNTEVQKLIQCLKQIEPYYNSIIWNTQYPKLVHQVQMIEKKLTTDSTVFNKLKTFYGSAWSNDFPFIISPYPIPGKHGNTGATPHGNCLCIGVLTSDSDYSGILGVAFHEMSHVLYKEQPAALQYKIDNYFRTSTSPYKDLTYNYLNEALATACGNGWAFKQLEGSFDIKEWYHNTYIDGLAHAIYPVVESYILADKEIDSVFITTTIKLFEKTFPDSFASYETILADCIYYYDSRDEKHTRQDEVIKRYFNVSLTHVSSPILHHYSIEELQTSNQPQFILVDGNYETTFNKLNAIFPELNEYMNGHKDTDFYVSFFDAKKRPVIIIRSTSNESLDKLVKEMKNDRIIDRQKAFHAIRQ